MEAPLPAPSAALEASPGATCATSPYRTAPRFDATPTPARPSRALTVASWALTALAFATIAASIRVTSTLAAVTRLTVTSQLARRATPAGPRLRDAVEDLARRERAPLFVAPGIDRYAIDLRVGDATEGSFRASTRALDSYAATRGLWLHDDGGVLRLERQVDRVDLTCAGTLELCAARVERLASVFVERASATSDRPLDLRLSRDVSAIEGLRSALTAAGYQVDVSGRTLYVSDGPRAARATAREASDLDVRAIGGGVFVVARSTIDDALENQAALMRSTRITPVERGGRVIGVRVFGIRGGDTLARLGFENGDVLLRINGFEVATPDRCLEAYARLRASDDIAVSIERRGRTVTLRYVIA